MRLQCYKCRNVLHCEQAVGSYMIGLHCTVENGLSKYLNTRPIGGMFIIDREAREIMYLVASVRSVCLSVRPSVTTITAEPFDLRP